jgi:hypothetical protein
VLALEQASRERGESAERLTVGVDNVPVAIGCGLAGAGHERRHFDSWEPALPANDPKPM